MITNYNDTSISITPLLYHIHLGNFFQCFVFAEEKGCTHDA